MADGSDDVIGEADALRLLDGKPNGKESRWFFVTFARALEQGITKRDLGVVSAIIGDEYVVGQEQHEDGTPHLHAVIHTRISCSLSEINELLVRFTGAQPHTVVSKRPADAVRYTCKEDLEPIHDGSAIKKALPWVIRAAGWCRQHQEFTNYDAFVSSVPAYSAQLKKMHKDYWTSRGVGQELSPEFALQYPWPGLSQPRFGVPQFGRMIEDFLVAAFIPGRLHKTKQLYLYGEPNVGKTTFIISRLNMCYCYRPTLDRWWMMNFNKHKHCFILFDEFDFDVFVCKKDLLKMLAGEIFQYPVKHCSPGTYDVNLPVIFVSNNAPPDDAAFRVRCNFIEVINNLY